MDLEDLMNYKYKHDPWIQEILTVIKTGQWQHKDITLSECKMQNDHLYYRNMMVISNFKSLHFKILKFAHDATIAGHPDQAKTYEIVQQFYY